MAAKREKHLEEQNKAFSTEFEAQKFRPGKSGNPGGRPKKVLTDVARKMLDEKFPNDPKGRTYGELAVQGWIQEAIKGNTSAMGQLLDRVEGKVATTVGNLGDSDGNAIPFVIGEVESNKARIRELLKRAKL